MPINRTAVSLFAAAALSLAALPAVAQEKSARENAAQNAPAQQDSQSEPTTVRVDMHEWSMGMGGETVVPGNSATFEIRNTGDVVHAFELEGEVDGREIEIVSRNLKPGESTSFTLRLPAGTYTVYCPIANHEERGMHTQIVFQGETP